MVCVLEYFWTWRSKSQFLNTIILPFMEVFRTVLAVWVECKLWTLQMPVLRRLLLLLEGEIESWTSTLMSPLCPPLTAIPVFPIFTPKLSKYTAPNHKVYGLCFELLCTVHISNIFYCEVTTQSFFPHDLQQFQGIFVCSCHFVKVWCFPCIKRILSFP